VIKLKIFAIRMVRKRNSDVLIVKQFAGQQEAVVLFRKFEQAKDEDLQTLLDDTLLLNETGEGSRGAIFNTLLLAS
jgi:hypothetical protein